MLERWLILCCSGGIEWLGRVFKEWSVMKRIVVWRRGLGGWG